MRSGARIIADTIAGWGLGPVFHVPGEGILDILDALADHAPRVTCITARHEGGMAFMASGAARVSGRPAICLAARVPGALNTTLALHTAMTDAVPLLMIIGQPPMSQFERESFLDTDLHRTFAPLSKWTALVTDVARLPEMLSRAMHAAMSGRRGPVVLIVPEDVSQAFADVPDGPFPVLPSPAPDAATTQAIATTLAQAERPIAVVGGSDWDQATCDALLAAAAQLDMPVATAYRRRDLFDNADPHFVGEIGIGIAPALAKRIAASDTILAIGVRLGELNTIGGGFHGFTLLDAPRPRQTLIHVHADAGELNRVYQAAIAVQATPQNFVAALATAAERVTPRWSGWTRAARAEWEARSAPIACPGPVDLPALFAWLRDFLPDDSVITVGAGAYALWAQRFLRHRRFGTLLGPKSGAMGYGLPAAIGAGLADPSRRVVALAGDGCFLMHGQELAVAVQYDVPVVTLVFNNNAYGAIRLTQERMFGRAMGTALVNPDFCRFAESFGALAERVTRTEDFAPAFTRAFEAKRPAVIEIAVAPDASRPAA